MFDPNGIVFAALLSFVASAPEPVTLDELNDMVCLVEAIHYESNGEKLRGKVATANVILKRADVLRDFPDSVCEVIASHKAFSYRLNPQKRFDTIDFVSSVIDKQSFHETLAVAYQAAKRTLPDITDGADHFYNPRDAKPSWSHPSKITVTVYNHRYLRLY